MDDDYKGPKKVAHEYPKVFCYEDHWADIETAAVGAE